jgi:hypothetical protein
MAAIHLFLSTAVEMSHPEINEQWHYSVEEHHHVERCLLHLPVQVVALHTIATCQGRHILLGKVKWAYNSMFQVTPYIHFRAVTFMLPVDMWLFISPYPQVMSMK